MPRALLILVGLALAAGLAFAAAVMCGSSGCMLSPASDSMLWLLRFPRAASAFAVGGLLALAGALMQVLLRNPLADPYVLGISGGAATGAMAASLFVPTGVVGLASASASASSFFSASAPASYLAPGLASAADAAMSISAVGMNMQSVAALVASFFSRYAMQSGALCGALLSVALLFGLARRSLLQVSNSSSGSSSGASGGTRLILTGVMIASGSGALLTLMLSLAPDARLRGMVFWLMGDLDNSIFHAPALVTLLLCCAWASAAAPRLNVLAHGDQAAFLLGVRVPRLRAFTLFMASLATAAAVSVAGTIGFIGLVVPHMLRLVSGNDQRLLLPASALAGGTALMLADLAARTVAAPQQLPVGVITALVGVPVFLFLLARTRS